MTGKNKSFIGYSHLEAIVFHDDYGNIHIQRTSSKSIKEREREIEKERECRYNLYNQLPK